MAIHAYPLILKDDYNAFRQILPDLPENYDKWCYEVEGRKGKDRHAYEGGGGSFESHDVRVNGGKFVEYYRRMRSSPTSLLYNFVNESSLDHG
jgi:hypothetical protein